MEIKNEQNLCKGIYILKWIDCSKELPPESQWVLLYGTRGVEWGIYLEDVGFCNPDLNYFVLNAISHWMPLPKPPKLKKG